MIVDSAGRSVVHSIIRVLGLAVFAAALVCAPRTACAQPALDIEFCPRGELRLDYSALLLFPPSGEVVTLAYLDDARDMVSADDGVLVASSTLGFFDYTAAPDQEPGSEAPTKPLWQAPVRGAAVARDGARLLALGSAQESQAPAHLVSVARGPDGAWKTSATDIPHGAEVLRLSRAGDRWIAILTRPLPSTAVEPVEAEPQPLRRLEIWHSTDGLDWTRSRLPARAARMGYPWFPNGYQAAGGNGVFMAAARDGLFVATAAEADGGALVWREAPPVLGPSRAYHSVCFDGERFVVFAMHTGIATTVDGVSWQTRLAKPDADAGSFGLLAVDGSLRCLSTGADGIEAPRALDEVFPPADQPVTAGELGRMPDVRLTASSPDGLAVATRSFLWRTRPGVALEAGVEIGVATSMDANERGVAVASDRVQFVSWTEFGQAKSVVSMPYALVAADDLRFLAVGVDPRDPKASVISYRLGTDDKWSAYPTGLDDDVTPLALTDAAGGWFMLVRRAVPVGPTVAGGPWHRFQLELLASPTGLEWRNIGEPLPDVDPSRDDARYAVAVGNSGDGESLRMMVVVDGRISTMVGVGAWTTRDIGRSAQSTSEQGFFAGIDGDGTMYLGNGLGAPRRSRDGVEWSRCRGLKDARGVAANLDVLSFHRDGKTMVFVDSARQAGARAADLFVTGATDRPATITASTVPWSVQALSPVRRIGDRLVSAAQDGLLASDDGITFDYTVKYQLPQYTEGMMGTTDRSIWVWPRNPTDTDYATAVCIGRDRLDLAETLKLPVVALAGCCSGDTVAFLGRAENAKDSAALVAWSTDEGRTWEQTLLPADLRPTSGGFVRVPMGWVAACKRPSGEFVLAISADLKTWRSETVPDAASFSGCALAALGDKLILSGNVHEDWKPLVSRIGISTDGKDWSWRAVPSGPFSAELARFSELDVSDGHAILTGPDGSLLSRDLERWYAVEIAKHPYSMIRRSVVDGVLFQSVGPKAATSESAKLERVAVPLAGEFDSLPFVLLQPTKPFKMNGTDKYAYAVAEWDAKMLAAKSAQDRVIASDMLISKWRRHHPDAPLAEGAKLTAAVILRLFSAQLDNDAADGVLRVAYALDQDTPSRGLDAVYQALIAALGKAEGQTVIDLMEDARDAAKGNPRKFRFDRPSIGKSLPMVEGPRFDIAEMRFRAGLGVGAPAFDLGSAYAAGLGVPIDQPASQFWMLRAKQDGFFDEPKGGAFDKFTEGITRGRSIFALENKLSEYDSPDSPEPTVQDLRARTTQMIELGCWDTMAGLGFTLLRSGVSTEERDEGLRLLTLAASRGYGPALAFLESCASRGTGMLPNGRLAAGYRRLAAERGQVSSMTALAGQYASGACIEKNEAEAKAWIEKAAAANPDTAPFLRLGLSVGSFRPAVSVPDDEPLVLPASFDIESRLREARAGNAAACWDIAETYRLGLGVPREPVVSVWWKNKAVKFGWNPDALPGAQIDAGSLCAYMSVDLTFMEKEPTRAFLRKGNEAGQFEFVARRALDLQYGLFGPASPEQVQAVLEDGVRRGAAGACSVLASWHLKQRFDAASVAKAIDLYAEAAKGGMDDDALGAAWLILLHTQATPADEVRALRLLLWYARVDEPRGIDPAKDPAAYTREAARTIAAWAEIGRARAMAAHAILVLRAGDMAEGRAWGLASELASGSRAFIPDIYRELGDPDGRVMLDAARIAWRCRMQLEQRGCLPEWSERAANSAPDKSKVAKALRALLDGTLDMTVAAGAAGDSEIFSMNFLETLAKETKWHPDLRGPALLAAVLGAEVPKDADLMRFMMYLIDQGKEPVKGVDASCLAVLAAALQYYGVGVPASPAAAVAIMFDEGFECDRLTKAGFAAQGLLDADGAQIRKAYDALGGQPWAGGAD